MQLLTPTILNLSFCENIENSEKLWNSEYIVEEKHFFLNCLKSVIIFGVSKENINKSLPYQWFYYFESNKMQI